MASPAYLQGGMSPRPMDTQQDYCDGGDASVVKRPMRVKVLYTIGDAASNMLARLQQTTLVPVVTMEDQTQIGVVQLHTCMQAIISHSPELMPNLEQDYTVYAYDYSEYDTPLVGQGLLSRVLASASPTPNAPANVSGTTITGRVCKNLLAMLSNGVKETLEVKLKLVVVPTKHRNQYDKAMDNYRNTSRGTMDSMDYETSSMIFHAPSEPDYSNTMHSYATGPHQALTAQYAGGRSNVGGYDSLHDMLTPQFSSDFDPRQPQQIASGTGSRPATPMQAVASQEIAPVSNAARPSSRASNRPSPVDAGADDAAAEEGPARKRAKLTQADKRSRSGFGSKPDSLRVAASTAASIRDFRPSGGDNASLAQDVVPRAPTPRPAGKRMRPTSMAHGQSGLRRNSTLSEQAISSLQSDGSVYDDGLASSPDIPSSPPVVDSYLDYRSRAPSSPRLPETHNLNDSGFQSDIATDTNLSEAESLSAPKRGKKKPVSKTESVARWRASKIRTNSKIPWNTYSPSDPIPPAPTPTSMEELNIYVSQSKALSAIRMRRDTPSFDHAAPKTTNKAPAQVPKKSRKRAKSIGEASTAESQQTKANAPVKGATPEAQPASSRAQETRPPAQSISASSPSLLTQHSSPFLSGPLQESQSTIQVPQSAPQTSQPAHVQARQSEARSPVPFQASTTSMAPSTMLGQVPAQQPPQSLLEVLSETIAQTQALSQTQPQIQSHVHNSPAEQVSQSSSLGPQQSPANSVVYAQSKQATLSTASVTGEDEEVQEISASPALQSSHSQPANLLATMTTSVTAATKTAAPIAPPPQLPGPKKAQRPERTAGMTRSNTWAAPSSDFDVCSDIDQDGASGAGPSASKRPSMSHAANRQATIRRQLNASIATGTTPSFCHTCGNIDTPTWRPFYFKRQPGKVKDVAEGDGVHAVHAVEKEARTDAPDEILIFKKWSSLTASDKGEDGFKKMQLCNPCGNYFQKNRVFRPKRLWDNHPAAEGGKKPRGSGKNRVRVRGANAGSPDAPSGPADEPTPMSEASPTAGHEINDTETPVQSMNPPSQAQPAATNMAEALNKAIQQSPARQMMEGQANQSTPDALLATPVRRLLFPSPRKTGEFKSLDSPGQSKIGIQPGDSTDVENAAETDKENCPPSYEDHGLTDLFNFSLTPFASPQAVRMLAQHLKTPTSSRRSRNALGELAEGTISGVDGSGRKGDHLALPVTPSRGPRGSPSALTPFYRDLLEKFTGSSSPGQNGNIELQDLFHGNNAMNEQASLHFDSQAFLGSPGQFWHDFLSSEAMLPSDMPMPSSPPVAGQFAASFDNMIEFYEDATATSGPDAFDGIEAPADMPRSGA